MKESGKSRKKPRRRGTQARANTDLQTHIASLGLGTPEEYRAWCRKNGFTGALNKDWSERRQERLFAGRLQEKKSEDSVILNYIHTLGLEDVEAYRAWCREHGFSDSLRKAASQRRKEEALVEQKRAEQALNGRRLEHRPDETLRLLFEGRLDPQAIRNDLIRKVYESLAGAEGPPELRKTFLEILLLAERRTRLFTQDPVIEAFGSLTGNTFIEGLLALCRRREQWIRPLEEWKTRSHNPARQFASLTRHLLARYPVPSFMDSAWFEGDSEKARRHQDWFLWIGSGQNIRKAQLPLRFTRQMAHLLPEAPADLTVEEGFRWAQMIAMGGDESLARAVIATRLGASFEEEPFWETVIRFLADQPLFDPAQVGPVIDYLQAMKFVPQEIVHPGGEVEYGEPPQPDFSMKGRTLTPLLRRVDEWHDRLAKASRLPSNVFNPSGISEFEYEETTDAELRRWTIRELLSSKELHDEGKAMSHCVGSYVRSCSTGRISIWSLGVENCGGGSRHRVMTVSLKNDTRTITQARGKRNALPIAVGQPGQPPRVRRQTVDLLKEGQTILYLWCQREGIKMSRRI